MSILVPPQALLGLVNTWAQTQTFDDTIISSEFNGAAGVSILLHDPTINGTIGTNPGDVGGFKFNFSYAPFRWTQGPGGEPNYIDDVWAHGVNIAGPGERIDATKNAFYLQYEARFYDGTNFGGEFHLEQIQADGTSRRPFTFFLPESGATGSGSAFSIDYVGFYTYGGATRVRIDTLNTQVQLLNGTYIVSDVNNAPLLKQKNAGGSSFVDVLKLDAGDLARIAAPLYVIAARAGAGATYPGNFASFQPTTANSGDVCLNVTYPSVTGSFYAYRANGSATTGVLGAIWNSSATATAHASLDIRVSGASGGDPFALFYLDGAVANWAIGLDNSDNDAFVVSRAATLGTNNALRIDMATVGFGLAAAPISDDGAALGSTSLKWSDLFLASGAVVNWSSGNLTLTHTPGQLLFSQNSAVNGIYQFNASAGTINGGSVVMINAGSTTGTAVGINVSGSATNALQFGLQQNGNGQASYRCVVLGTGDPFFLVSVAGVRDWSIGIDNSDNDKFKISLGSAPGTEDGLTVDTSLNVGIGTLSSDRRLQSEISDAVNAAVTQTLRLTHVTSGTPGVGIGVGMEFEVETSNNNNEVGATIEAITTDVTAASEDFDLVFKTMAAGAAAAERMRIGIGVQVGTPTGGDKGAGTINVAGDIFKNNTAYTNPDFVFEHYYAGGIRKFANASGADQYSGLIPLAKLRDYTRAHMRLPDMDDAPKGMFERSDIVLAKLEEAHLYIMELHDRIEALEHEVRGRES